MHARVKETDGLESYAYSLRNTLSDNKISEKLDDSDEETLDKAISETVSWLDDN